MGKTPTGNPDTIASPKSGSVTDSVEAALEDVSQQVHDQITAKPWFRRVAQVGWVAKGIVYGSLGWAAIEISLAKSAADDAEYTGIVRALADGAFTRVLLAVIAIGLVFYILFRLLSVALIDEVDLNAWAHRIAYLASAFTYITISWAAATAILSGSGENSESSVERISTSLLGSGLGRVALALAGIGALGVAIYFVVKGATRRFMSQVDDTRLGTLERRVIEYSGAIGWIGRGITVGVVAAFVTWSALDADPNDVRGIDSSMHRVANSNAGQAVVLAIGVCLLVYAMYCILSARRRRLAWEDNPEPAADTPPASFPIAKRSNP